MADAILYRQRRRGKDGELVMLSTIVRRVPTQDELKALYTYDPETGLFTHLESRGKGRAGHLAGKINANGYVEMRVCNRLFAAASHDGNYHLCLPTYPTPSMRADFFCFWAPPNS